MKKYICKECFREVNPDSTSSKRTSSIDMMKAFVQRGLIGGIVFYNCRSCKNRTSKENTVVFDTEDPVESLKHVGVVEFITSDSESISDFMSSPSSVPFAKIKRSPSLIKTMFILGMLVFSLLMAWIMVMQMEKTIGHNPFIQIFEQIENNSVIKFVMLIFFDRYIIHRGSTFVFLFVQRVYQVLSGSH